MGVAAALKAREAVEMLETVLALELIAGAQALEFLRPLRPGRGVQRAYELVRADVAPLDKDRELSDDIATVAARIRAGAFARLWETE